MYLAAGIALLAAAAATMFVILFTMIRTVKSRGEVVVSKKNLVYLVPTFLLVYFLHLSAWAFNGGELNFFSCFTLLSSVIDVIAGFKADSSLVLPICREYPVYYAAFVLTYIAGGATVILSIASFFSARIRNFFSCRKALRKGCDVVIGDCADSVRFVKGNRGSLLYVPGMARPRYAELIKGGVTAARFPLRVLGKKLGKREYNFILFGGGNVPYTRVIEEFLQIKRGGKNVALHMEANQGDVKVIKERFIAESGNVSGAYINCFSKHELIARRFVAEHPITKYIPRSFYNENCTLKNDKEINVVFAGFGKMNYQLFRMCSMQFQFAAQNGGRLQAKPVHYYIYDRRDEALHNEFFSRILYEFDEDFKDCDFPRPERICDLAEISCADIDSVAVKKRFKELVGENSFTYFIVSLETDLEDASYAQTIRRLFPDSKNYRIFVRAKNNGERFYGDDVICFGGEDAIYTHDGIVNDDLSELARRINMLYDSIEAPPQWLLDVRRLPARQQGAALDEHLRDPAKRELMRVKWEKRPMIEQASNLYHALNMPFKLNMLGFDMVKRDAGGVSEEEFCRRYVNTGRADGYKDVGFFFGTQSSNVLAFIEHSRWNALYILYDYRQMKKKDIAVQTVRGENGAEKRIAPHKNVALRRHACITTYYGLRELIEYKFGILYPGEDIRKVAPSDARLRELYNIYQYDYMDLDRLYSEIASMGYVIVEA